MLSIQEVRDRLEDHDDRIQVEKEDDSWVEIRMLGSMLDEETGDFVIFVVIHNGERTLYDANQEDEAIKHFLRLASS